MKFSNKALCSEKYVLKFKRVIFSILFLVTHFILRKLNVKTLKPIKPGQCHSCMSLSKHHNILFNQYFFLKYDYICLVYIRAPV